MQTSIENVLLNKQVHVGLSKRTETMHFDVKLNKSQDRPIANHSKNTPE